MRKGFHDIAPRKVIRIIGSVGLYCILFAVILALFRSEEEQTQGTVFGSMEGRFLSDITMEHDGETYYYRENEITNYLVIGPARETGGQAEFLVILSIDRSSRTVTPVRLAPEAIDPAVSEYGDMARCVEELLYGVRMDHYFALLPEASELLDEMFGTAEDTEQSYQLQDSLARFRTRLADDTTGTIQWMRFLMAHISTDASGNTILRDIRTMAGYSWRELQTMDHASTEEELLREQMIPLWFHKGT